MILINTPTVETLISCLGWAYRELGASKKINAARPIEISEGSHLQYTIPVDGVQLSINAASGIVTKVSIDILKPDDESWIFEGALPERYAGQTQAQTREKLGTPVESKGYHRLPYPLPPSGGWDKYEIDAEATPPKYLYVTYNTEMVVRRLTFALPYTDD
ncbi:DUF6392 family protein [Pseudomonas sp. HR96]|uniref:DUF6392 family protein n=1 Tax=Pseudomonas sp. HR96 TaxID=1027966 RepID=UPI002A7588FF|nr:DUF6392 family protein [Pseudomonas sp. HR96]WPP00983.1 DUF6392 family protein [Pseudomonas sp. HR96]